MLRTSNPSGRRRGMILIVVLSLLTLFAIVGISFVLVSDSLALSARIAKEAETTFKPNSDPEGAFSFFLGQLVYDVEDNELGVYSGLRGHSLARTMYGYNPDTPGLNDKAFGGIGRPRIPSPFSGNPSAGPAQYLGYLVNHTYFPADGFLLDPERTSWRANPSAARGPYVSAAAPYTYPDHNSFFLAMQNPTDGGILVPSFHRPWLFGSFDRVNPNWTNAQGKYLTLRPRPADHGPGFPYPEDLGNQNPAAGPVYPGGDVKNLIGSPGGNDSIWIDLGSPVMTSADGRKYKMLFAPLILDLDGRVNVNVHGNVRSAGTTHASHQGWGPWEVNPQRVLAGANELQQLVYGDPATATAGQPYRTAGRYGLDRRPGVSGAQAPGGTVPRVWGQVNFDAIDDADGSIGTRFLLPGEPGTLPYQPYPTFPAAFGNGLPAELTDHPLLYNPLRPHHDDRLLAASNMASLLRQRGTGAQALTTELARLLPQTYADAHRRNLITTHSADIDRPGATPYVWDRTDPTTGYAWNATNGYPAATNPFASPFTSIASLQPATPASPTSEFSPTWHSELAAQLRVNLNRALTPYPAPDAASGGVITDLAGYTAALQDRVDLAQDLFDRLWRVTGAADPSTVAADTDEFRTLRWLAQLAVNMVDFVDPDDYLTQFPWHPATPTEFVIGTEQPGLLINEVFAQYENLANDQGLQNRAMAAAPRPQAEDGYQINVWAELYNPRVAGPSDNGTTQLVVNGQPVYQLVIASYNMAAEANTVLNNPDNVRGEPAFGAVTPAEVKTISDWPAGAEVLAGGGRYDDPARGNNGFYAVGPVANFLDEPDVNPNLPTTHLSGQATLRLGLNDSLLQRRPVLLLRRLACPHLAPGANNPYVTIDTFRYPDVPWEANPFTHGELVNNRNPFFTQPAERRSFGRFQPFAAGDPILQQPNPALVNMAQHTFYRHNYEQDMAPNVGDPSVTFKTAGFDWLAHLDRQVVSPIELLQVSAWKPHQLTEKFVQAGNAHQHVAKWFDPATRLHRFLEFVQTAPRTRGVTAGGRIPGKININTMMDLDVFRALCDAQPGNRYTDAEVQATFTRLMGYRSPGLVPGPSGYTGVFNPPDPPTIGGPRDRPFWSLAMGQGPGNDQWTSVPRGIEQTLLAPTAGGDLTSARLLDPFAGAVGGAPHPYYNLELLNKIYNNVTTRSNVFAVWVTVGYFEVADENSRPVKLGAEIGRTEGRHIRHRFFAVVDRTKMEAMRFSGTLQSAVNPVPGQRSYATINPPPPGTTNPNTGKAWTLQPGAILTFQPETDVAETTAVEFDGASGTYRGEVRQPYTTDPLPIIQYGNPGPWPRYSPKKDPCVLYFSLID